MESLPGDLLAKIMEGLPFKYVLRCKCVSKSLDALLTDPSFALAHYNKKLPHFIDMDKRLVYFIDSNEEDNETSTTGECFKLPFVTDCLTRVSSPILMGSCLGYVCFSSRGEFNFGGTTSPTNPIYLFNPITRDNISLPKFEATPLSTCLYGFGFDASAQKCKVVLVYLHDQTFSVQVHTVGSDSSWRTNTIPSVLLTDVTGAELTKADLQTSLPLDFNGSIHWIVLTSVDNGNSLGPKKACILSFQLDTEEFRVIPMPEPLQVIEPYFYNKMMYALQVSGGCLSIIYSPEPSIVDVWVMDDYNISESWVKKHSIPLNCMEGSKHRLLGIRKNDQLMLRLRYKGRDKHKIVHYCSTIPFPFVASLISLKPAYGDSKVVGTSGFGNPIQKQQRTMCFEVTAHANCVNSHMLHLQNGDCQVQEPPRKKQKIVHEPSSD